MEFRYYLFFFIIILNIGLIVRFRNHKYFYFFLVLCLIDPVSIILNYFKLLILGRYYITLASTLYLIAFPLFDKKIRVTLITIIIFSLLLIQGNPIISLMSSSIIYFTIIAFIASNQLILFRNENKIEVFHLLLILSIALNIIRTYFFFEYPWLFNNNYTIITLVDIVITLLIIISGPYTYIRFRDKIIPNSKSLQYDLSKREIQIIKLITKGLTSKEIADKLFLSKKTIDQYRSNIKSKLNISQRSELINFYTTNIEPLNHDPEN